MATMERRATVAAAELDAKCLRAWRRCGDYTQAARALGVTSKFLRAAVERAETAGVQVEGRRARIYRPPDLASEIEAGPAEERSWLVLAAQGGHVFDVAALAGVPVGRVVLGMQRARNRGLAWWEAHGRGPRGSRS